MDSLEAMREQNNAKFEVLDGRLAEILDLLVSKTSKGVSQEDLQEGLQ